MRDRSRASARNSTGSYPPIIRWPISKVQPTWLRSSTFFTSLGRSIIVPRWGWIACDMPWAATISSISSSIAAAYPRPPPDFQAGRPVEAGDHRRDEQVTAGSAHQRCGPFGSGKAGVALSGVVEHDGNKAADHLEVVAGAHLAQFAGVGREIAVGSEFGGGKPEFLHLGQHTVDRKFQPQPGTSQTPQLMGAPATR